MHSQLVGMFDTINVGLQVNELAFTRDGKLFMQATSSGVEVPTSPPIFHLSLFWMATLPDKKSMQKDPAPLCQCISYQHGGFGDAGISALSALPPIRDLYNEAANISRCSY